MRKYDALLLLGLVLFPRFAVASGEGDISLLVVVFGAGCVIVLLALYAFLMLFTAEFVKSRTVAVILSVFYTGFVLGAQYWCFNNLLITMFYSVNWRRGAKHYEQYYEWSPFLIKCACVVGIIMLGVGMLAASIWSKRYFRLRREEAMAAELGK